MTLRNLTRLKLSASKLFSLLTLITAICLSARAAPIPPSRLVDWNPGVTVGVPGGIPTDRTRIIDVTLPPYNADRTGATDASAKIIDAINAATSGDIVYLPAGTYRIQYQLYLPPGRSGITIRGSGESTVMRPVGGAQFAWIGSGSDYRWDYPSTGNTITAGLTKGSTAITIADTTPFAVGQLVQISLVNNPAIPVVSVFGYDGMQRQMTRITGKSSTALSIFPGLYGDYSATTARVSRAQVYATGIGLEDMLVDMSASTAPISISFQQAYGCWAKNVRVRLSKNYHMALFDSLNCEVRHCYLDELSHSGSNGSGLLVNTVSGSLFEDNIIYKAFPLIEVNHGSSGNVFAYNFLKDSGPGVAIDSNHGPHNAYNLYEGNITPNLQADGYFGSVSDDTIFRNWLNGEGTGWYISLNRFTRNYSVVGNLMNGPTIPTGNPNMGNGSYTGFGPPWSAGVRDGGGTLSQVGTTVTTTTSNFSSSDVNRWIYTFPDSMLSLITAVSSPTSATVNTNRTISGTQFKVAPGPSGYQESDTDVAATLFRSGNFNFVDNGIPASEALGGTPLPNSLYLRSKPAWFGSLTWPAFDPTASAPNPSYSSIPAGYRFANPGQEAPGLSSSSVSTPPTTVAIRRTSG